MPELPEVEIVKRSLFKIVNNAKINGIKVYNNNLRYKLPKNFCNQLINKKITKISRRSKYLIFHFKKKILLVHLGMTGKFIIIKKKSNKVIKTSFYYNLNINKKHNHVFFKLNNNLTLIYNDVRRFGFFKLYDKLEIKKIKFIKKLGVEPFSKKFSVKYFKNFIKSKKKNIKNLLMDQTFISGLGNIYVNEVLYMSKINPYRLCKSLSDEEIKSLILNIVKILKFSINKGGASIKNFQNTLGESGKFQQFFYVYNQYKKKCSRISCTGEIKRTFISNRSSFYCNKCQQ